MTTITASEQFLRQAIARLNGSPPADEERELCITPYEGRYGIAGYVIAVNGSPPKGTLFVPYEDPRLYGRARIFALADGQMRRVNDTALLQAITDVLVEKGFLTERR